MVARQLDLPFILPFTEGTGKSSSLWEILSASGAPGEAHGSGFGMAVSTVLYRPLRLSGSSR